ncbi:MAG: hypothetical protein QF733_05365 [Phycisphaerales bacterium]|nr:hypothetical protein [Phycisphaerales bacterium]
MEFIPAGEAAGVIADHGLESESPDEDHIYLRMRDGDTVQHHHVAIAGTSCSPREGAAVHEIANDKLADVVDHLMHKLHHSQILLIPVGKWRSVFDVVAFSLAANEEWQRIDAAATVELNSRDPLLADAGDLHLLCDLAKALLADSEKPDQGLMLISVGQPVVMEIVPTGGVRLSFGNQAIADELAEAYAS